MRIGYSFWGFLSDYKIRHGNELSTPDGNAFYSWSIINALTNAGHDVFRMMPDRDAESVDEYGRKAFTWSTEKRYKAYKSLIDGTDMVPPLDVLLLEWRFPIPGRNCEISRISPDYQPDLDVQTRLLNRYRDTSTKIIVMDLDYKLTKEEEVAENFHAVLETSLLPKQVYARRYPMFIPFDFSEMNNFKTLPPNGENLITYVGNRYDRDEEINKYLAPIQHEVPINLYGNWTEKGKKSDKDWPGISFHKRIAGRNMRKAYQFASVVPLFAKREYKERGFMTARILEALFYGAVPVAPIDFYGINVFLPRALIFSSAEELMDIALLLHEMPHVRESARMGMIEMLRFMDAENFVKTLEKVVKEDHHVIQGKLF